VAAGPIAIAGTLGTVWRCRAMASGGAFLAVGRPGTAFLAVGREDEDGGKVCDAGKLSAMLATSTTGMAWATTRGRLHLFLEPAGVTGSAALATAGDCSSGSSSAVSLLSSNSTSGEESAHIMTSTGSTKGRCGGFDVFGRVALALPSLLHATAGGDDTAGEHGETERLTGEPPPEAALSSSETVGVAAPNPAAASASASSR